MEWISVKDKWPDEFQIVVLAIKHQDGQSALVAKKWMGAFQAISIVNGEINSFDVNRNLITHWMPLPEPPKPPEPKPEPECKFDVGDLVWFFHHLSDCSNLCAGVVNDFEYAENEGYFMIYLNDMKRGSGFFESTYLYSSREEAEQARMVSNG